MASKKIEVGTRVEILGFGPMDPNFDRNERKYKGQSAMVVELRKKTYPFVSGTYNCTLIVSGVGEKSFSQVKLKIKN